MIDLRSDKPKVVEKIITRERQGKVPHSHVNKRYRGIRGDPTFSKSLKRIKDTGTVKSPRDQFIKHLTGSPVQTQYEKTINMTPIPINPVYGVSSLRKE